MARIVQLFNKDAHVDSAWPATNYNLTYLDLMLNNAVKGGTVCDVLGYANFLAYGLAAGDVTAAYCRMWCYEENENVTAAAWWRNTADFDEATVTYATMPGQDGAVSSDVVNPAAQTWVQWTVTSMVTDAITSRGSIWNATCIPSAGSAGKDNATSFHSSEGTNLPHLAIYHANENIKKIGGVTWQGTLNVKKLGNVAEASCMEVCKIDAN